MIRRIVVFSGAGMSAESGLKTFRDSGGLWETHRIEDVATPEAWARNPELVLNFYNQRFLQLKKALPNHAHLALVKLESCFEVEIITQNVDDLHERAGSSRVLHLHGELVKCRSSIYENDIYPMPELGLRQGDCCRMGHQLRPHIVWFGEAVPAMYDAELIAAQADLLLVIGTSLNVYPAAGLIYRVQTGANVIVVDPGELSISAVKGIQHYKAKASDVLPKLVDDLLKLV